MCLFTDLADVKRSYLMGGTKNLRHYIIYQNEVANLAGAKLPAFVTTKRGQVDAWNTPLTSVAPGNAMIWPVPSRNPIMKDDLVSFDQAPGILREAWRSYKHRNDDVTRGAVPKSLGSVQIHDVGVYTVVVSNGGSPEQIDTALREVPTEKRPRISPELLEWFRFYPDWPLIIACFANTVATMSIPFGVFYDPIREDLIYLPGADAHDGKPPDMSATVDTDHVLLFGADQIEDGWSFEQVLRTTGRSLPPQVRAQLPDQYVGVEVTGNKPNGDWVIRTEDLLSGRLTGMHTDSVLVRSVPPEYKA